MFRGPDGPSLSPPRRRRGHWNEGATRGRPARGVADPELEPIRRRIPDNPIEQSEGSQVREEQPGSEWQRGGGGGVSEHQPDQVVGVVRDTDLHDSPAHRKATADGIVDLEFQK